LLALAHHKNHIIVVDGPPETGKSHTIAALTYWANENKKSVVITSHKQEALNVIDRLSVDLKNTFPDMQGLSPRNLKYMRKFAEAWPERSFVQASLAQISWYHNLALLEKLDNAEDRL